jgi:hypothetical protein
VRRIRDTGFDNFHPNRSLPSSVPNEALRHPGAPLTGMISHLLGTAEGVRISWEVLEAERPLMRRGVPLQRGGRGGSGDGR